MGLTALILAARLVSSSRAVAAPTDEREVQAGRALFATHCATSHGEGGRGDGASASGFATRAPDPADARPINGLPDQFPVSRTTPARPAQGTAPTMPSRHPPL